MHYLVRNNDNEICGIVRDINDPFLNSKDYKENYHMISVHEFLKDCKNDEEKIDKVFKAAKMYHDNWFEGSKFAVEVIWGDWSHDHGFCDRLMSSVGYERQLLPTEVGSFG